MARFHRSAPCGEFAQMTRSSDSPRATARRGSAAMVSRVQKAWGDSPFYQAKLRGPAPDRLLFQPDDPATPDATLAEALIDARLALGVETVDCEGELERIWDAAAPAGALFHFLHSFAWLRHLDALGERGGAPARRLTKGWLDRCERWSPEAWEPFLTSERLVQICAHHPRALGGGDALWRSRVLSSMARQTRHLAHAAHRADNHFERLLTALNLTIVGHCLPGCEGPAMRGLEMARRELRMQLRADGGHVSRNPTRQLKVAARLQTALKAVERRGGAAPGFLRHAVMRAGAMAAFFRCADGRLAVFNGGYEDDPRAVLAVVASVDLDSAPTAFARHSGYHKLTSGRALLMVDAAESAGGFESGGSFHFSSGRSRLIVNCGNGAHRGGEWRAALRARGAHSALSFDSERAPEFGAIACRRAEDARGSLLEIKRVLAAVGSEGRYERRFFLGAGGGDLRGEEFLSGLPDEVVSAATFRFHLHPSVKASIARDGKSVLALLDNKEGWRFKSNAGALRLERTVYCGDGGAPTASQQIVLSAQTLSRALDGSVTAKWALRRLDAA